MRLFFSLILLHLSGICCQAADAGKSAAQPGPLTPMTGLAETGSLLILALKVVGGLALVVGLMLLFFIWLKKMGFSRTTLHQGSLIEVLDTRLIGPKKYVSVLRVAGECLAVGVSDQQITLLSRLDSSQVQDVAAQSEAAAQPGSGFAATLAQAGGWKKK